MSNESAQVIEALGSINRAWLGGRPRDMEALIHPQITMVFPGFTTRVSGREKFISGFVEFCQNARIISYDETVRRVDVIAELAVASYEFVMVYEREGSCFRASGRDLWVFAQQAAPGEWLACWRTMLDLHEEPAEA
jgi:hypothetical protein